MAINKYNINQIPFSNFQVQGPGDKIPRGKKKKKTKEEEQTEALGSFEPQEEEKTPFLQRATTKTKEFLQNYSDRLKHKKIKEDLKKGPIYNPYSLDPEKPISTSILSQDFMNQLQQHPDYFLYNEPGVQIYDDVNIYATEESKKTYKDLIDKAKATTKTFLTAFPNGKRFLDNIKVFNTGIEGQRDYIKKVNELGQFLKGYQENAQEYYKARRLVKEGKLDTSEFEKQYKEKGWNRFDSQNKQLSREERLEAAIDWWGPRNDKTKQLFKEIGTPEENQLLFQLSYPEGRQSQWQRFTDYAQDPQTAVDLAKITGAYAMTGGLGSPALGALKTAVSPVTKPLWNWVGKPLLFNPYMQTALTGYGYYNAATHTIPKLIENLNDPYSDPLGTVGYGALAGLEVALPFIPLGKIAPKGFLVKDLKDLKSSVTNIKNIAKGNIALSNAEEFKSLVFLLDDYEKLLANSSKTSLTEAATKRRELIEKRNEYRDFRQQKFRKLESLDDELKLTKNTEEIKSIKAEQIEVKKELVHYAKLVEEIESLLKSNWAKSIANFQHEESLYNFLKGKNKPSKLSELRKETKILQDFDKTSYKELDIVDVISNHKNRLNSHLQTLRSQKKDLLEQLSYMDPNMGAKVREGNRTRFATDKSIEGLPKEDYIGFKGRKLKFIEDTTELSRITRELNDVSSQIKSLEFLQKNYDYKIITDKAGNKVLTLQQPKSPYKELGTIKTDKEFIKDFQTGEEIPFNIKIPTAEIKITASKPKREMDIVIDWGKGFTSKIKGKKRKPQLSEEIVPLESDYSMNPLAKETVIKNREYVVSQLEGSAPFGSSTLIDESTDIVTASDDIDVIMTADDWALAEKSGKHTLSGKDAKYGPGIYLNGNKEIEIDVNIVRNNPNTGMAEGELALELYRQYYPDKYYAEVEKMISGLINEGKIKTLDKLKEMSKSDIKKYLSENIKIDVSAEQLVGTVRNNPRLKTYLDGYEAGMSTPTTSGFAKIKHINRPELFMELGNPEEVAQAQKMFIQSIVGSKGSTGHQFTIEQLSNVEENLKALERMGLGGLGLNLQKIAESPERMQLFLNDYYIFNNLFARNAHFDPKIHKNYKEFKDAFITWKLEAGGGSLEGWGLNSIMGASSSKGYGDFVGFTFFNLPKQQFSNIDNYLNAIEKQTRGSYELSLPEKELIKELAVKHSIKLDESSIRRSENLINPNFVNDLTKKHDVEKQNIPLFLKDLGEQLGIKAITKVAGGSKETGFTLKGHGLPTQIYASTLGNLDEQLDALTVSLNELEPIIKGREFRIKNLKDSKKEDEIHKLLFEIDNNLYLLDGYRKGAKEALLAKKARLDDERTNLINYFEGKLQKLESKGKTGIKDMSYRAYGEELERQPLLATLENYEKSLENLKVLEKEVDDLLTAESILESKFNEVSKFGKFIAGATAIGTGAAIGTYYFQQFQEKQQKEIEEYIQAKKEKENLKSKKKKPIDAEKVVNTKKYGGALNTFNYQQNKLSLPDNMPSDEIYLSPEEIEYYRSLGYDVEELD